MNRTFPIFNSIFRTYLVWIIFVVINFVFTMYTSDFNEKHGSEIFNTMYTMFAVMLIVLHGIGAALAWYTQEGKRWAKWLFILFCLSFALDSFFSIIEITDMYKHTDNYNPFKKSLFIIVWCTLAGMAWVKSSNKSFKPTPKSGAV